MYLQTVILPLAATVYTGQASTAVLSLIRTVSMQNRTALPLLFIELTSYILSPVLLQLNTPTGRLHFGLRHSGADNQRLTYHGIGTPYSHTDRYLQYWCSVFTSHTDRYPQSWCSVFTYRYRYRYPQYLLIVYSYR